MSALRIILAALPLLACAAIAEAQKPAAAQPQAPPEVEQALRARVNGQALIATLHLDGRRIGLDLNDLPGPVPGDAVPRPLIGDEPIPAELTTPKVRNRK